MKKTTFSPEELGLDLEAPIVFVRRRNQKYLRIRIKPEEIEVGAPYRMRLATMKEYLVEKNGWVEKQWKQLIAQDQKIKAQWDDREKEMLWLGHWYPIKLFKKENYLASLSLLRFQSDHFEYHYTADLPLNKSVKETYYRKQAKKWLPGKVAEIADAHGFKYNRVYVRDQKTKWGSCSSKSNISLNWRLILCPEEVINYLIIHECCHLTHMNHSPQFWNLVGSYCPNYQEHEQWLRENEPKLFRWP